MLKKYESSVVIVKLYSYELKIRKEIECYDKVMELRPKYPQVWYKLGLEYKKC